LKLKRFLALLLTVVMVMPLGASNLTAKAETEGLYTYSVSNGKAAITSANRSVSGDVEIPETLGGYIVTDIKDFAFSYCTNLTSVIIPNSVKNIGKNAFSNCNNLTSITLPDDLETIDSEAFSGTGYYNDENNWENDVLYIDNHLIKCKPSKTGDYTIKSGTKTIAYNAFKGCADLENITLPDGITVIGEGAFSSCDNLKNVNIPNGVNIIKKNTFISCDSLESISIPPSITNIEIGAFDICDNLLNIYITDVAAWCNIDFEYNVCNPLYYAENLYLNNVLVTDLEIPQGVTEIKKFAFYGCKGIESISIPKSITKIGDDAFALCRNLKDVYITDISAWCNIDFEALDANPIYFAKKFYLNNELVTNLIIPEGTKVIKDYAFFGCDSLNGVFIPSSVITIGNQAFGNCNKINNVYITDISAWCNLEFKTPYDNPSYFAENLYVKSELVTELVIPESVTEIKPYAFYGFDCLTSLIISENCISIGEQAFAYCDNISTLYLGGSLENFEESTLDQLLLSNIVVSEENENFSSQDNVLFNKDKSELLLFPKGLYATKYTIPDGVKVIADAAFRNCFTMRNIVIPKSVTTINESAFNSCNVTDAWYTGNEQDKNNIVFASGNNTLKDATWHYNIIPENGHVYENSCDKTCNVCEEERTAPEHKYKSVITKATLSKNGKKEYKCTVCGYVASNKTTFYRPSSFKLSYTSYTYNGKVKKPTVTVKGSDGKIISSKHYTVTYAAGRKNVGKYKVTIKFKGNYSGTKTIYFTIKPPKTTVSSLTAYTKKLRVNITKKSSQVTGYQIQYSTSKKFSSYKTKTVTSCKTTSAYLTGLKTKTTYYVRVRTYKTVNGKKYYSDWSSYKYKKTK